MIKLKSNVGATVSFMYPARGRLNTLRNVVGKVVRISNGPHGDFVTVEESKDKIRSFSFSKIVNM